LYSILKDRTVVDKELEELRRTNFIRICKLLTGCEDFAIVLTSDYVTLIQYTKEHFKSKNKENTSNMSTEYKIFDLFMDNLPKFWDVSVTKDNLEKALYPTGGKLSEDDITILINAGFLLLRDVNTYWISIPNVGRFVKSVVQGRKELLSFIKKQKWQEILEKDLLKRKLRYSKLDNTFHLKDLIGKGFVTTAETTAGPLIRLVDQS